MSDDWIIVSEDIPLEKVLAIDVDGNFVWELQKKTMQKNPRQDLRATTIIIGWTT